VHQTFNTEDTEKIHRENRRELGSSFGLGEQEIQYPIAKWGPVLCLLRLSPLFSAPSVLKPLIL
jgi:hypothetical protein